MSESDKGSSDGGDQRDEAEVIKELEEKCQEAFQTFDKDDSGTIESNHCMEVF